MDPTVITVEEARQLMTAHGQDMLFLMLWNSKTGETNIVTAGSTAEFSQSAAGLADRIAQGLQLDPG